MAKKTGKTQPADIDVLPAGETEEVALVTESGGAIAAFIGGFAAWVGEAVKLQKSADARLAAARTLKAPSTPEDDEILQRFCKTVAAEKRSAASHYVDVKGLFYGIHRRISAREKRTEETLESAHKIANQFHNGFVEQQKRRAQELQDKLRREAEEKARRDREAELAELERQALDAEKNSPELSEREQVFVSRVLLGLSPYEAAKGAGFKNPEGTALRLSNTHKILKALDAGATARAVREQAAAMSQQPLDVQVEEVQPDIIKAIGASDRTTKSAELLDEEAFIAAVIAGKHGIPVDVLTVDVAKLNTHARSLGELINRWPGVRLKSSTRVV